MGQLIYSMNTSLDGYVADREGRFDFGEPDEEVMTAINDWVGGVGIHLYGRRTYELMQVWETDPTMAERSPLDRDFTRLWQESEKIVYSTTLPEVSTRRTRLERRFDPVAVRRLKEQSTADLLIEGPTLAAHALRHGLVDEVQLFVCPISLGGGLSFLPDFRVDLRLRDERRFTNGVVQLRYDMAGP